MRNTLLFLLRGCSALYSRSHVKPSFDFRHNGGQEHRIRIKKNRGEEANFEKAAMKTREEEGFLIASIYGNVYTRESPDWCLPIAFLVSTQLHNSSCACIPLWSLENVLLKLFKRAFLNSSIFLLGAQSLSEHTLCVHSFFFFGRLPRRFNVLPNQLLLPRIVGFFLRAVPVTLSLTLLLNLLSLPYPLLFLLKLLLQPALFLLLLSKSDTDHLLDLLWRGSPTELNACLKRTVPQASLMVFFQSFHSLRFHLLGL